MSSQTNTAPNESDRLSLTLIRVATHILRSDGVISRIDDQWLRIHLAPYHLPQFCSPSITPAPQKDA